MAGTAVAASATAPPGGWPVGKSLEELESSSGAGFWSACAAAGALGDEGPELDDVVRPDRVGRRRGSGEE
eukprot:9713230-Alexandrium_andersonii.AAC.1